MLNDHSKVGIALIIFYVPAVLLAAWLLFHRHAHGKGNDRPRLAWIVLLIFSLIRVASGIVLIVHENQQQEIGPTIAAVILLNAGVFPVIAATIGLIWIIQAADFQHNSSIRYGLILSRVLFFVGIALLIAGGSLEGNYNNESSVMTGLKLVYFWRRAARLSLTSMTVLKGASSAMPFFVVRLTYAFLSVFKSSDLTWNPLAGPVGPFVAMALVMEYLVHFAGAGSAERQNRWDT
ncbi:hypothetical protein T310_2156 [Rasamsonia emersonii CBS 393.64]|uniref:DUF7702 domain-containing protein n=1 Tax=Rasamsonia emersonii (strain ATCC 16479 / CBS 393.64 / IMI 116815) TaxID=1408163 RepID=A0A0F4Z0C8_RASE3|nr:hypothetical protein T310_2156 [Rasamsonia emersonii CBS 393.64]KKA23805.1 hypothetical protein T310_2156 [Rasamsonia emersonii CBS 393.64]